jgi:hypothetical protein
LQIETYLTYKESIMERPDPNIMPEIHIGMADVARAALDGLKWFVSLPSGGYPSEYPKHPERRGAAAMLDAALDQPQLPFEPLDGEAAEARS